MRFDGGRALHRGVVTDCIVAILKGLGMTTGSWLLAASTGAIAAWVLTYFRESWNKPKLHIAIDNGAGSVVETDDVNGNKTRYARLVIRNQGRTLAKNCCVAIDYIKRKDPTGSDFVFRTDLIDLRWSLLENPVTTFNVSSKGHRLVDVGHTYLAKSDFDAQRFHKSGFWIDGALIPNRLKDELKINATYEVHIRAYADNASPREFSCCIGLGDTFRDLTFERCHDPRPRELR
jgi:hypothetical protein